MPDPTNLVAKDRILFPFSCKMYLHFKQCKENAVSRFVSGIPLRLKRNDQLELPL